MKKIISILSGFIVLLLSYNLILFLVRKNNNISFWLSYGEIMFASVMFMLAFILTSTRENKPKVVGLSIKTLCFFFLGIEFIMGTIFMFLPNMPTLAVLIPNIVTTALFLLLFTPCALQFIDFDKQDKQKENN